MRTGCKDSRQLPCAGQGTAAVTAQVTGAPAQGAVHSGAMCWLVPSMPDHKLYHTLVRCHCASLRPQTRALVGDIQSQVPPHTAMQDASRQPELAMRDACTCSHGEACRKLTWLSRWAGSTSCSSGWLGRGGWPEPVLQPHHDCVGLWHLFMMHMKQGQQR